MRNTTPAWGRIAVALLGILIAALLVVPSESARAEGTAVSVSPSAKSVQVGDSFDLDVRIDTDRKVQGWQFGFTYDASVLEVINITPSNWLQDYVDSTPSGDTVFPAHFNWSTPSIVSAGGVAILNDRGDGGPTGQAQLARISLRARGASNSAIQLTDVVVVSKNAQGTAVPLEGIVLAGGSVVVAGLPTATSMTTPTSTTAATATSTQTATPSPAMTVATTITSAATVTPIRTATAGTAPSLTATLAGTGTLPTATTLTATRTATATLTQAATATGTATAAGNTPTAKATSPVPTPTGTGTAKPAASSTATPTATPRGAGIAVVGPACGQPARANVVDKNDLNVVNINDIIAVGQKWLETGPSDGWIREDVKCDGKIDIADIIEVGKYWLMQVGDLTPDLVITAPSTTGTGASYTLSFKVKNIGNGNAGASKASYTIDGGAAIEVDVPALNAGAEHSVGPIPLVLSGSSDSIAITADALNEVAESDENNTTSGIYTWSPPDLVITEHTVDGADANYTLKFKVKNQGTGNAGASKASYTVDGGVAVKVDVPALAAGTESSFFGPFNLAMSGAYDDIVIRADSDDDLTESNETNNSADAIYYPRPAARIYFDPATTSAARGSTFTMDVMLDLGSAHSLDYQFGFTFNKDLLQVDSVVASNVWQNYVNSTPAGDMVFPVTWTIDNANGVVIAGGETIISDKGDGGPTGLVKVATVTFTAKNQDGISSLTLTNLVVSGSQGSVVPLNGKVIAGSTPAPDLTITGQTATVTGATYTLSFKVKNQGTANAGPSRATYTIDGGPAVKVDVPALVAGAEHTVGPINLVLSGSSDTIVITADALNTVEESDESNTVTVNASSAQLPDLVIIDQVATGTSANYTLSFKVKNQGSGNAGASKASYAIDGGTPVQIDVPVLAAGAEHSVGPINLTLTGSSDNINIRADSSGAVAESDESNNTATVTYSYSPSFPDLVIIDQVATGTSANYTLSFKVKNQGSGNAGASKASYAIDGGTPVQIDVPVLAAGAEHSVGPINLTLTGSSDNIVITADSGGVLTESSETNNSATVIYPTPSARIYFAPSTKSVAKGSTFTMDVMLDLGSAHSLDYQFGFTFNKDLLQVDSVVASNVWQNYVNSTPAGDMVFPMPWTIDNANGVVIAGGETIISDKGDGGPTGINTVATVTFTAKNLNGTSTLTLTDLVASGAQGYLVSGNGSVTVTTPGNPDFVIVSPSTSGTNQDYMLSFKVKNQGTGNAGASTASYAIDGREPQREMVPELAAGGEYNVGPISLTLTGNSDSIEIKADSGGDITETDETNNTTTVTYAWTPPPKATVTIDPPTKTVGVGDTFTVNVKIKLSSGEKSRSAAFGLEFNRSVVKVNSVTAGSFYTGWASNDHAVVMTIPPFTINNTDGRVGQGGISIQGGDHPGDGPSGEGVMAVINLTALAQGESDLKLKQVEVATLDQNGTAVVVGSTIEDGRVVVGPASATTTPTPTQTMTVTPTGTATATPTRTALATYTPNPTLPATAVPTSVNSVQVNGNISVIPAVKNVRAGDTFTLDVQVNINRTLSAVQFSLTFNPAVVKVNSVEEGTFLKDWADQNGASTFIFPSWEIDNTSGRVSPGGIALLEGSGQPDIGPRGQGVVAIISLTALANGTSDVALTDVIHSTVVADTDTGTGAQTVNGATMLGIVSNNGSIVVGGPTSTPTLATGGAGTQTPTLAPGAPTPTTSRAGGTNSSSAGGGTNQAGGGTNQASGGAQRMGATSNGTGGSPGSPGAGGPVGSNGGNGPGGDSGVAGNPGGGNDPGGNGGNPVEGDGNSNTPGGVSGPATGGVSIGVVAQTGGQHSTGVAPGGQQTVLLGSAAEPPVLIDLSTSLDERGVVRQEVLLPVFNGLATLLIPPGTVALTHDRRPLRSITIQILNDYPILPEDTTLMSHPVEFGPSGATFDPPIKIAFRYEPSVMPPDLEANDLEPAYFDPQRSAWVPVPGSVDAVNRTVTAEVSHFTTFAVLTKSAPSANLLLLLGIVAAEIGLGGGGYLYVVRRRRLPAWWPKWLRPAGEAVDEGPKPEPPPASTVAIALLPPPSMRSGTGFIDGSLVDDSTGEDREWLQPD